MCIYAWLGSGSWKLFACEQNMKGDTQWVLNYFCLCQLTPEALGITNLLCAGIRKFTTLSKCWVCRPPESVSFLCFPVKTLSQHSVLTPFPACTLLLPSSIKSFALWVYEIQLDYSGDYFLLFFLLPLPLYYCSLECY